MASVAANAGASEKRGETPLVRTLAAPSQPRTATAPTLNALVNTKNSAVRSISHDDGLPSRWSTQSPIARPLAPPAGASAFAPTSDMPIR